MKAKIKNLINQLLLIGNNLSFVHLAKINFSQTEKYYLHFYILSYTLFIIISQFYIRCFIK